MQSVGNVVTGMADSLHAVQMSSTMSKQVRGNLAGRVKTALAAGAYDKVKDCEKELEGAAIPRSHQSCAWIRHPQRMQR